MNDVEKMMKKTEYMVNPKQLEDDVKEFGDVIEQFVNITQNPDVLNSVNPYDLLETMVSVREFVNQLKPFVIKYGIIQPMLSSGK